MTTTLEQTAALATEAIGISFGIQNEPGGYRIMLRGSGDAWESAYMGGLHGSMDEAMARLAREMRNSRHAVTYHDDDLRARVEALNVKWEQHRQAQERERIADEERARIEAERIAGINAAFAGAKFRKTSFAIAMRTGEETCSGWAIAGLAAHKTANTGALYVISHVASGLGLGLHYAMLRDAKLAAFRLSQVADWTRAGAEISKDKTLGAKVAAVRVDPYGAF